MLPKKLGIQGLGHGVYVCGLISCLKIDHIRLIFYHGVPDKVLYHADVPRPPALIGLLAVSMTTWLSAKIWMGMSSSFGVMNWLA